MKTILICLLMLGTSALNAQVQKSPPAVAAKNDIVLKLNGDELTGKVSKITDTEIEFSYAGEDLTYAIKKSDIMKITFASGRIQIFNKPSLPSESKGQPAATGENATDITTLPSLEEHHNKVAILPFTFLKDGQLTAEAAGDQIQNECYSMMSKHAGVYTIVDPRTSNVQLIKAGVTKDNIKGYTMNDLCNILNVEYVVDCTVAQNKTVQTTMQSNSGDIKNTKKNNTNFNSYSYGTATQSYKTNVTLNMYNDKGSNVYSQNRNSFWATQDAYKNTLEYLLKRSPLYSK